VHDTGFGIPADQLKNIFDRFYRVDKSRSRAHGGSGIGLTIARHLVEAHGGKIWAESAGQNKGSVFTFTLPLA
jgi:signal transduction histidine kinase